MQPERTRAAELGLAPDEGAIARKILEQEHVPSSAIVSIDKEVTSTYDEAKALAAWSKEHNARRLLVPTDLFHTRRAGWMLQNLLKDSGTEVRMIPLNHRSYTSANWWQSEQGALDFQNEMLKYTWYIYRY
jgi:uncharacterized SAM-binding protein YcdF (DUF218 family)